MKLFLYKLQLAGHLGVFLLKLSANISNKTKPVLIGIFVFGLIVGTIGLAILPKATNTTEVILNSTVSPTHLELFILQTLDKSEVEAQLKYWQSVAEKQPESRDVLFNISQLYSALHLEEEAALYKAKAVAIDPNNPLFQ